MYNVPYQAGLSHPLAGNATIAMSILQRYTDTSCFRTPALMSLSVDMLRKTDQNVVVVHFTIQSHTLNTHTTISQH